MKKLFIVLSMVLLLAAAVAEARSYAAYSYNYGKAYAPVLRFQTIKWGNPFNRQTGDGRIAVTGTKADAGKMTLTFATLTTMRANRNQSKATITAKYDQNGKGKLNLAGKTYSFMYDSRRHVLQVAYLSDDTTDTYGTTSAYRPG